MSSGADDDDDVYACRTEPSDGRKRGDKAGKEVHQRGSATESGGAAPILYKVK